MSATKAERIKAAWDEYERVVSPVRAEYERKARAIEEEP